MATVADTLMLKEQLPPLVDPPGMIAPEAMTAEVAPATPVIVLAAGRVTSAVPSL